MTRIQSSTGLITGIPIQDTVNQLMTLAAQPRTALSNRTKSLESQKLAVTQLTSLIVAFQFEAKQMGTETLFDARSATTNDDSLSASVAASGTPAIGNYLFTPVQTESVQQLMSQTFGATEAIGAGSFTFGKGGFLDQGIALSELNSGTGIEHGKIKITDRSGASAVIDLTYARGVDDVLAAISENTDINVKATAVGDSFVLTDLSGGTGNLKVQEVAGGSTAADLGLGAIDVAASTATGADVFTLHSKTTLGSLNDGAGVQLRAGDDLSISLADETTLSVDLGSAKNLGDVLTAINAASPTKLSAAISSDGNRIELTDLTTGSGMFAVANVGTGTAADDLGLITTAAGDTITGMRLVSGLRDTLVSSLKGGAGLGTLGQINIINRSGDTSNVNLASAETLGQIIAAINSQAAGVTAEINGARNGITLSDTTGATASNLIVANGDANNSATALGLVTNSAATTVNGTGLQRQQISAATLLSSLKGGKGIDIGDFKITDTNGVTSAVDLDKVDDVATTIGDVIARINALEGLAVEARINERGDGIELIGTAGGAGKITVTTVGTDTTAADLGILGTSTLKTVDGQQRHVIDGTATTTVSIDADDTLTDVVKKINDLGRGVTASILNDGQRQRLSLVVNDAGSANELFIDTSGTNLSFEEISSARDALMLYGTSSSAGALISSSSNTFENVISGLNVTVNEGSLKPVRVNVKSTSAGIVSNAKELIASYNSMRKVLGTATDFNAEDLTTGILFGTNEALRIDSDLSRVFTSRYTGVGQFDSLVAVGINVDDKGQLSLDEAKLTAAFNKDPSAVKKLFTDKNRGFAAKMNEAVEKLAGEDGSVLDTRTDSLTRIIDANKERLETMDAGLLRQRDRLLLQFYNLETTVARMQDSLAALSALQVVPPLTSTR